MQSGRDSRGPIRPAVAIRDSERDSALLIQHLIDEALDIGSIVEAVAVAVAQWPTVGSDGQAGRAVGAGIFEVGDAIATWRPGDEQLQVRQVDFAPAASVVVWCSFAECN